MPALEGISLEVAQGEFVALAGLNGSGKSTLCRLFNALMLPTRGRVISCGLDTSLSRNLRDVRRSVGLIMQNPDNQIVGPTVEDDVAFGLENLGLPAGEIHRRVEDAMEALRLTALRDREPHLLSLGEKKRLSVAGVIAISPRILVSDESTSMLDPPARTETMAIFRRLCDESGITIVHATHRPEEVLAADRVVLLGGGHLSFTGSPHELFAEEGLAGAHGLYPTALYLLTRELERLGCPLPDVALEAKEVAARLWASR